MGRLLLLLLVLPLLSLLSLLLLLLLMSLLMSLLLALMAVAFAGQGIKALQEAGMVGAHEVPFFTLALLGIHPTAQTLAAQALAIVIVVLGYRAMHRPVKQALAEQNPAA